MLWETIKYCYILHEARFKYSLIQMRYCAKQKTWLYQFSLTVMLPKTKVGCINHHISTLLVVTLTTNLHFYQIPLILLLYMFEHLHSLSANIRSSEFKLEIMFTVVCCPYFGFLPLTTTEAAKRNLGKRGRPNPTNRPHQSFSLVVKTRNLKRFWSNYRKSTT
jgi:hypothetical protein